MSFNLLVLLLFLLYLSNDLELFLQTDLLHLQCAENRYVSELAACGSHYLFFHLFVGTQNNCIMLYLLPYT